MDFDCFCSDCDAQCLKLLIRLSTVIYTQEMILSSHSRDSLAPASEVTDSEIPQYIWREICTTTIQATCHDAVLNNYNILEKYG